MTTQNPYDAPTSEGGLHSESTHWLRRLRLICGIVIVVAILFGIAGTVIGMTLAFRKLAAAESVDPSQLAQGIADSLFYCALAIPTVIIAFVVRSWATLRLRRSGDIPAIPTRRSKWKDRFQA